MKKIAVIVLNFNGKNYLEQFLPTLIAYSPEADIIIADNASTDDSCTFLQEKFQQIDIIKLEKNYGFTGGYNRAIAQMQHEWIILLNSDVEVTENWITPMKAYLEANPDVAMVQPKILSQQKKDMFDYAGASGGFIDFLGYPFCRGRIFDTIEMDSGQFDDISDIAWATGAAVLIPRDLFIKSGGFDEYFFAHMEEIDLAWRLRRAGYRIVAHPGSVIYHVGGGTLDRTSPHKTKLNFRNSLWVLQKNLQARKVLLYIFLRMSLDGIAGIKFLFEGKGSHFLAILKAHFEFYAKIPAYNRARKEVNKKIKEISIGNINEKGTYHRSIVWDYYIKKITHFKDLLK